MSGTSANKLIKNNWSRSKVIYNDYENLEKYLYNIFTLHLNKSQLFKTKILN